jgi:hypothetical protein
MQPANSEAIDAARGANSRKTLDASCAEASNTDCAAGRDRSAARDLFEYVAAGRLNGSIAAGLGYAAKYGRGLSGHHHDFSPLLKMGTR